MKITARNRLAVTISQIEKGAATSLVGLALAGGGQLTASITNDAVTSRRLVVGQAATAVFKAYAVMLAVRAT